MSTEITAAPVTAPAGSYGKRLPAWLAQWLRHGSRQREVERLTARQLTDAGIDPALAGRGRAAACDNPERVAGVGY